LLQEAVSFILLFNLRRILQIILVFIKIGASPFHFWIFYFTAFLWGFSFLWFFIYSKIIYLPLILFLGAPQFFLFLGLFVVYLQILKNSRIINLLIFTSLESFNWNFLLLRHFFLSFMFLILFYFFRVLCLVWDILEGFLFSIETIFIFISIPLIISFRLKLFAVCAFWRSLRIYFRLFFFLFFLSLFSTSYFIATLFILRNNKRFRSNQFLTPILLLFRRIIFI